MARLPRLHAPDAIQYLVQRAASSRLSFIDTEDAALFVRLLESACRQHGFALHAYALTPHEIHLLGTPSGPGSPARVLQSIGRVYVPWINRKAERTGALWERRFRSTIVDPEWILPVMHVIEGHANREGIGTTRSPCSSHAHHVGLRQAPFVTDHARYWALSDTPFERQAIYRDLSTRGPEPAFVERLRQAVEHGWAFGSADFLGALEQVINRRASPLKRGRPKKDVSPNRHVPK